MIRGVCCLLLIISLDLITGCSPSYRISSQNLSNIYDPENNYLHPQYVVYHFRDDSSRLYLKINSSELLYKKNESGTNAAQVSVSYKLFNDAESKYIVDSSSITLNDYNEGDPSGVLIHSVNFKTPLLSKYILEVEMKDNFRQQSVKSFITIDKSGRQSAQHFFVKLSGQQVPLFRNDVTPDEYFNIITPDTTKRRMFVRCYFRTFPLAAPPFAEKVPEKFEYAADSIFTIDISPASVIKLEKRGFYHFQYDTTVKQGLTIFRFDEDFPKVTDEAKLLEGIRFLTTKKEYDELLVAKNKRTAIDKFWLDLAGSEQRGKVLIRKYYTRIQDANILFSSYLEGWKTDRGLIYTIFGPPSTVYKSSTAEDWMYGNYNYNNSLTFTFEKIYNPFSDNDYILRRSDYYESAWYRAVDRWRQGVVINE